MSDRIQNLQQNLRVDNYPLCMEKSRIWMKSFQATDGKPHIIRRAKAFAEILENISIFIEDGELIVGNVASKPGGLEVTFWPGYWPQEEIDGLKRDGFRITPEDEQEIKLQNDYWRGKSLTDRCGQIFDNDRLWPYMQTGIALPPWEKGEGVRGGYAEGGMGLGPSQGLLAADYERVLRTGLNAMVEEAKLQLKNIQYAEKGSINKVDFLNASIISNNAVINFASRFADLAGKMASNEPDPLRKKELERIEATCRWVPANAPRNFYEAIQFFWFIFLMINPSPVVGAGRFDQYMYPYYKKDIESGKITDEEVLELLQCLRIKDMQINFTSSKRMREKRSGNAKWHNFIIGGVTRDGKDATNELTYLLLEAARKCQTPHHTITLRVHDGTPEKLMLNALEVVRTGIGMPAFIGDKSCIEYLRHEGIPMALARDYILTGCLDISLPGQSRIRSYGMFIVPFVFDIFMHNGVVPKTGYQLGPRTGDLENFSSFSRMFNAFKEHLKFFMALQADNDNVQIQAWRELEPDAFVSSLMVDGLKESKTILDRKFILENGAVLNPVGMINVADSLAAMKKLIYEDKKYTMKELKDALAANWKGEPYEKMRKDFLSAPKYGNNYDYVDSIVKDLYKFWADTAVTFDTVLGGKHKPSAISISSQSPGGALTGATPDGRNAGECLADGSMSAMQGRDTNGPTALINSALKVDQAPYQATLLNMKFHPSALKTTEDLQKLSSLIKTYFSQGGKHVQFNVVSKEMLIEAQNVPEKHKDLVVRVAGYSAYFVQLDRVMQGEVIGRNEYQKTK